MSNVVNAVAMIGASSLIAPLIVLDPPAFPALHVSSVERFVRGTTTSYWGWSVSDPPEELPARMIVKGWCGDEKRDFVLAIDLEEHVITHGAWDVLCGTRSGGSGEIGVLLFGIPGIIIASPLLLVASGIRASVRTLARMDWHVWSLWLRIRGQLSKDDARELKLALRNHFNGVEDAYVARARATYDEELRRERLAATFDSRRDNICDGPFMLRYESGTAELEEAMQDLVDWHKRETVDHHVPLHEWMGMTIEELAAWRAQRTTIDGIVEARRRVRDGENHASERSSDG